ncbi:MAG: hypothetical protein KF764_28570 [Labilithrix sp.]|nr:hypothetical protein [Labilithrix sp.]MBX3220335.1 hypothetical protein [Labilithrix sp.]
MDGSRERSPDVVRPRLAHRLGALLLAAAAAASGACSLLYASDLNDLRTSPGLDADPRSDGGGDGRAPLDGPDAADAGDAASPTRGCAAMKPAPRYCRDFDDGAALESDGWSLDIDPPGKLLVALDQTSAYSAPASLRASLLGAPGCSYGRLVRAFPSTSSRLDVRVRIRPTGPWSNTEGVMITHIADDGANACAAILYLHDDDNDGVLDQTLVNMQTQTTPNDVRALNGAVPTDEWTELGMVATPVAGGSGVAMTFSIRRESGSVSETTEVFAQCTLTGTTRVKLGFHCEDGTGEVRYDDLRVDWE